MKARLALWFLLLSSVVAFGLGNNGVPPFFGANSCVHGSVTVSATGAGSSTAHGACTSVTEEAWGSGAGGSGVGSASAVGGGGGGYSKFVATVTANQTIFYVVGLHGNGGAVNGSPGGLSWVNAAANSQPVANGAVGGGGLVTSNGVNSHGVGSIGTTNFNGGDAGNGNISPGRGGGGGGSAGSAGNGGNGVGGGSGGTGGTAGTPDGGAGGTGGTTDGIGGFFPGGGGGGGWNGNGAGGNDGKIKLTW